MSIHQKPDGRYFVVYYVEGIGKRVQKRKFFGRGLKAQLAAEKFDEIKRDRPRQYKRRKPVARPAPTFRELALEYLDAKAATCEASTLRNMAWKFKGVIFPAIGHLPTSRITPHRITQYINKRLETPLTVNIGTRKKPEKKVVKDSAGRVRYVKRTTVHRELCDIQAVLNWAAAPEQQYIIRNPIVGITKPKRDDSIIMPPSATEIEKLIAVSPERLKRALTISYYTGLRPGRSELLGLTFDDIDFDAGVILIRSAKKMGPRSRLVPLHDDFKHVLKDWKEKSKSTYIITYRGKPIKSIKKAFTTAKRKAGITRRLRPYDMRHAFATRTLDAGGDMKAASQILGHSRPDTTMRIYQHTSGALHRDTVNRLPKLKIETLRND